MLWAVLAVGGLLLAVSIGRRVRLYRRMFSEAHFRELHARFAEAVDAMTEAWRAGPGDATEGDVLAQDAFVTSAQVAIAVTASLAEARHVLHVSLSQASGYTTSAAANRFGFFLVTMLEQNALAFDPFVTPSRVHHLVFTGAASALRVADFAAVDARYRRDYRPLPYLQRSP